VKISVMIVRYEYGNNCFDCLCRVVLEKSLSLDVPREQTLFCSLGGVQTALRTKTFVGPGYSCCFRCKCKEIYNLP